MSFEDFWSIYPRRVAKLAAKRKYEQALRHASERQILDGARAYARVTANTEMQFIKHPATWLHGGCWEDDMSVIAPRRQAIQSPTFDDLAAYYDAQAQRESAGSAGAVPLLQDVHKRSVN